MSKKIYTIVGDRNLGVIVTFWETFQEREAYIQGINDFAAVGLARYTESDEAELAVLREGDERFFQKIAEAMFEQDKLFAIAWLGRIEMRVRINKLNEILNE